MDFLLGKRASLKGVVTDVEGNAIPGVGVIARELIGIDGFGYKCVDEISANTDGEGQFELSGLPEGFAHLRCRAASLNQRTSIFELYEVSPKPWKEPEIIKIIMVGTAIVKGEVVGQDGEAPTREIIVELEPKGGHKRGSWGGSMQCKEDGGFEFAGVPPGEYLIIAKPNPMREGEASKPILVVIRVGDVVEVQIVSNYVHEPKAP